MVTITEGAFKPIEYTWLCLAVLRLTLMFAMSSLGQYFVGKLRGSKSYIKEPAGGFSPTCHAILYPYHALGFPVDLGTYGDGRKPTPEEVESWQWGLQVQRYTGESVGYEIGEGVPGFAGSWAYSGEECTLDLVTSESLAPRWLLLVRDLHPNSTEARQVPMDPECGGSEPGPWHVGPEQFDELRWSLWVWLLLRLGTLFTEWLGLYGLAAKVSFFKTTKARYADFKEHGRAALVPSLHCWEACKTCTWCFCGFISFSRCRRYQTLKKKAKSGKNFKRLTWLIFTLVPNILLSPISGLRLNTLCTQVVVTFYSPRTQRIFNYACMVQFVDILVLMYVFKVVMKELETTSLDQGQIEHGAESFSAETAYSTFCEERVPVRLLGVGWLGWSIGLLDPLTGEVQREPRPEVSHSSLYYCPPDQPGLPETAMRVKQIKETKDGPFQVLLKDRRPIWERPPEGTVEGEVSFREDDPTNRFLWRPDDGNLVQLKEADWGKELATVLSEDEKHVRTVQYKLLYPPFTLQHVDPWGLCKSVVKRCFKMASLCPGAALLIASHACQSCRAVFQECKDSWRIRAVKCIACGERCTFYIPEDMDEPWPSQEVECGNCQVWSHEVQCANCTRRCRKKVGLDLHCDVCPQKISTAVCQPVESVARKEKISLKLWKCYGFAKGIMWGAWRLLLWLLMALLVLVAGVFLLQVPIVILLVSLGMLAYNVYMIATKGYEFVIPLDFSYLTLFLYPTFDFSFNLSVFYLFACLLMFLDFLGLTIDKVTYLVQKANKYFVMMKHHFEHEAKHSSFADKLHHMLSEKLHRKT